MRTEPASLFEDNKARKVKSPLARIVIGFGCIDSRKFGAQSLAGHIRESK